MKRFLNSGEVTIKDGDASGGPITYEGTLQMFEGGPDSVFAGIPGTQLFTKAFKSEFGLRDALAKREVSVK